MRTLSTIERAAVCGGKQETPAAVPPKIFTMRPPGNSAELFGMGVHTVVTINAALGGPASQSNAERQGRIS